MRVLFVYIGVESMGVEYLAATARKAGHEVSLAFDPAIFGGHLMWDIPSIAKKFDKRPQILKKILEDKPDVVAFSCVTANYIWSLELAREIKKHAPEIQTVFGGIHVTAVPHRVIEEQAVDNLIVTEADLSFPALLTDMEEGRVERRPGVWRKAGGELVCEDGWMAVDDLDALPFPAKDLFYNKAPVLEESYTIMASRGCPYMCSYCHNSLEVRRATGANKIRRRSVINVIEELEPVAARGRVKIVKFFDDVFSMDRDWLAGFTAKYISRIKLPYFCFSHPNYLSDEVVDLLAEGGCKFISIGIQSVDEGQRRNVLNRKYDNEVARRCVRRLKKRGVSVFLDQIVGIPGDTHEMMCEAVTFYNELKPARLLTYWLTYFPGTEILKKATETGLMSEEEMARIEDGNIDCLYDNPLKGAIPLMEKFRVLFALIPILPAGWIRFLLKNNRFRFLPGSYMAVNIAYFINAMLKSDAFFLNNVKYLMSKKNVP